MWRIGIRQAPTARTTSQACRRYLAPVFSNSTVGQLALGDITNIDIFVILDAMERSLETIERSAKEKEETAIQRMREAGGIVASSAAGTVLAAALRQALGLP
jgi:hypothetical protein